MRLCRPLVPLEIGFARKDLVAAIHLAGPRAGLCSPLLRGGRPETRGARGVPLLVGLAKGYSASATSGGAVAEVRLGELTVCLRCARTMADRCVHCGDAGSRGCVAALPGIFWGEEQ